MEDSQKFDRTQFTLFHDIEDRNKLTLSEKENEPLTLGHMLDFPYSQTLPTSTAREGDSTIFERNKINSAINSEAILLITDQAGYIIYLNENCCKNVGYKPEEVIGKHTRIFKTGLHSEQFYHDLWSTLLAGETWKGEMTAKRKDGSVVWNFLTIFPILDEDNQPKQFLTLRTDITKQKQMETQVARLDKQISAIIHRSKKIAEEMKRMAYFDYLTGLPNRRYLENQLRKEVLRAKGNKTSFALMLIDLDEFKYVNNSFGHSIGDQLLEDFSARLRDSYSHDEILCRLGGDEFIILVPGIFSLEEIHQNASKLISLINDRPFNVRGNDFFITISVGVSVYPYSGESMDLLLKNADMALYRAKSNGKNQHQIFSPTMNLFTYKQFTLRNDSKKALTNNEFSIFYQPRFNPITNELTGAEALIRWNHPKWGLVSPDEFISMAEESGLIVPIGAWMLKMVCHQLKSWQMNGLPIKKVSINISSLELLQSNFIEMVSSTLKENNLDPKWIEFEITERMIIDKEEKALKTLMNIKKLGISLALDDFGTGYSAINYLWKFPCDIIKIDKSLIKEMQDKSASYEVVAAIIALCKKLKKMVVAEGVETTEQLELLRELACEEIQGYLFCKPVREKQFAQFLRQGKWIPENKLISSYENKRQYFRVPLTYPLEADMTIERIGMKVLNIGSTKVLIEDIGPGGLRFISAINLPKKEDIILRFTTEIFLGTFQINGHIVWSSELDDHIFQYGVKFNIDEIRRESLIKILNNLQIKLKDKNVLMNGRFISEEKTSYIQKLIKGEFPQSK